MPLTAQQIYQESKVATRLQRRLDNLVRDMHYQAGKVACHLVQHSHYRTGTPGAQERFSDIREIAADAVKDISMMVRLLNLDQVLRDIEEMSAEIEEIERRAA
jgi:hypothetical protein